MAPALDHPLRHASYRWLLSGVAVNSLGNGIAPVALAFAVLDLGGDASDLGVVVGLYALADVAAVLFGGVLGDRLPRTVMMQGSSALAAVAQGLVAASLIGGWSSIPLLAGLGMVNGCARGTRWPELVGDHPADRARGAAPDRDHLAPDQPERRRDRGQRRGGPARGRRRERLGAGGRRVHVRVRGRVLRAGARRAARRTGGAREHARRRPGGLRRGDAAHLAVAADPAGAALPPVLRRRAGRARPDRGR